MSEPNGLTEQGASKAATPTIGAPGGVLRRGQRRPRRAVAIGMLTALGIAGVAGGGTLLARELARPASPGAETASGQDIATRWQLRPAGEIFPSTVGYPDAEGLRGTARLVGIAPQASCQAGLDQAAWAALRGLRCAAVLRATYADGSGALLATVGVAVLGSPRAAAAAAARLAALRPVGGLRAVAFEGTIANRLAESLPAAQGRAAAAGPYVFFYAAGYADGQPGQPAGHSPDLDYLGRGLLANVERVLARP